MKNRRHIRKHERLDMPLEATFSDGQRMYVDTILNLSLGGLCIECPKRLDKGDHVTVILPSNPPIRVNAMVRWCTRNGLKYKIGLQFDKLLSDQEQALRELISTFFWEELGDKAR